MDAGETPEAAALREAEEEVALDPATSRCLAAWRTTSPAPASASPRSWGCCRLGWNCGPSPEEVEAVFELPLEVLLDPHAPQRQRRQVRGHWREYWVWPHPEHFIWGATAAILVHLAEKLRAAR